MTSIKVTTAAVAASVCLHAGWAQEAFNLVPLGGTAATRAAADSDTVKVQGRGVGIDEVSALKDAYRDAIERAVGLYVDAEQVAKNNELVKDQILTQSNAYITDYQKLSSERIDGGLVQLRILATVKKQALTKKISDAMPTQVFSLGSDAQNLHAQMTTTEKRGGDAASLLRENDACTASSSRSTPTSTSRNSCPPFSRCLTKSQLSSRKTSASVDATVTKTPHSTTREILLKV